MTTTIEPASSGYRSAEHGTLTASEPYPPVNCAPGCEDGDGHTSGVHMRDDQYCHSDVADVPLTLEDMVKWDDEGSLWVLKVVRVYAVRDWNERNGRIHLGLGEDSGFYMTAAEARALGEVLIQYAEMVGQS